jgi:glucose/arabinose dehydrogenase
MSDRKLLRTSTGKAQERFARTFTVACVATATLAAPASASALALKELGSFNTPTFATSDPADSSRLFIVEQDGVIRLSDGGVRAFLDIADLVRSPEDAGGGNEQGLLSMAFSPDYPTTGLFYVFYTAQEGEAGALRIDEFDADAEPVGSSRRPVIEIPHVGAAQNHNGGQLQFGPDGHLYVSTGDGGTGGANAQDLDSLLGKILRIAPSGTGPGDYSVPSDNPFAGATAGEDEIWSYGLRNPWRFSFDRATRALMIGDVGQGSWEELNYHPASAGRGRGDNFGWNCREGMHNFSSAPPCDDPPAFTEPVFEYANDSSTCAITGGYVVRDQALGDLYGRYLYADFCAGQLRSLNPGIPTASDDRSEGLSVPLVTSFGEDADCRIYVVSRLGPVYRLTEPAAGAPAGCPQLQLPPPPSSEPGPIEPVPGAAPPPDEGAPGSPPSLDLRAKKQELRRKVKVVATASVTSTLVIEGKKVKDATKDLVANQETKVKAKLKRKARNRLEERLDEKRKANVKVNGTATNQSGATAIDKVKVKLKD